MAGVSPCLLGTIKLSMALAWYRAVDVCGFSHVAASLVVLPCQLVRMHMRTRWVALCHPWPVSAYHLYLLQG